MKYLTVFISVLLVTPLLASCNDCANGWDFIDMRNLTDSHASFIGEQPYDCASIVEFVGDVNGDGYDDLLVSSPGNDEKANLAGQIYLIFGKENGWSKDTSLVNADASFLGENSWDGAGSTLSRAGDINGDGYDDFLIGAPYYDPSGLMEWYDGIVYIIYGKPSGWKMDMDLFDIKDYFFINSGNHQFTGRYVEGAGDINGDGYDDIMFFNSEKVHLFFGKKGGIRFAIDPNTADVIFSPEMSFFISNSDITGRGDFNNDGFDDIAIGAFQPTDPFCNKVYLVYGKGNGWDKVYYLKDSDVIFIGDNTTRQCKSLSISGDINDDGFDDLIIGEPSGKNNRGIVDIFFGRISMVGNIFNVSDSNVSIIGKDPFGEEGGIGWPVSGGGDVNGDGIEDLLISNQNSNEAVRLLLGKSNDWKKELNIESLTSFTREQENDAAGYSFALDGDLNGDGYDDIIITAGNYDGKYINQGKVYIIFSFSIPPYPSGLNASLVFNGKWIKLIWNSSIDWSVPITGFRVYRSCDGTNYEMVGFSQKTFIDWNVLQGVKYYYSIVTVAGGELSKFSSNIAILCENDHDNDTVGDSLDPDDDGDGIIDIQDMFPLDPNEYLDTDRDGIGNNNDADDDNDGISDVMDAEPLNPVNGLLDDMLNLRSELERFRSETDEQISELDASLEMLSLQVSMLDSKVTTDLSDLSSRMTASEKNHSTDIKEMKKLYETLTQSVLVRLNDLIGQMRTLSQGLSEINNDVNVTKGSLVSLMQNYSVLKELTEQLKTIGTRLDIIEELEKDISSMNETLNKDKNEEMMRSQKIYFIVMVILIVIAWLSTLVLIYYLLAKRKREGQLPTPRS